MEFYFGFWDIERIGLESLFLDNMDEANRPCDDDMGMGGAFHGSCTSY